MKKFNIKALATSLSAIITATLATQQVQASDIEIYTIPSQAQKTIVMMLDTSGSMRGCDVSVTLRLDGIRNSQYEPMDITHSNLQSLFYFNSGWNYTERNRQTFIDYAGTERSNTTPSYDRDFCYGQTEAFQRDTSKKYYDRMTKLKDAVFALMESDQLDETVHIAVGEFTDSSKGSIQVPSAPLTAEHKLRIKRYIAGLSASGSTPTASAYAEAAAYMLGTNTRAQNAKLEHIRQLWVQHPTDRNYYYYCGRKDTQPSQLSDPISELNVDETGACTAISGSTIKKTFAELRAEGYTGAHACRGLNGSGYVWSNVVGIGNFTANCMFKDTDTVSVDISDQEYNDKYSGFAKSVDGSKKADKQTYKSPLPATGRECSGQSIYFLTDGEPNNANNAQYLMRAALADKAGDFPTNSEAFTNTAKYLDSSSSEGMAPAGELAKRLREPELNPQGIAVTTALVGFGADFIEAKNVKRSLIDGKGNPRDYYDCSKITKRTIRNACNFGEKAHAELPGVGGYGEGGFYYAEDSKDLIDSFLAVANGIDIEFNAITTGAPTIPVSALNRQRLLADAYYASFVPQPDKAQQLWTGNMNKYTTQNGALHGQGNQALFQSNGLINTNTLGLWDKDLNGDTAKGVFGNLPLRTDVQGKTLRQVYTEGGTNRGLVPVTVDSLRNGAMRNHSAKNYWLNLLGFKVTTDEQVNFNQLTRKEELRQLGATMHSSPLLLTQSGKIDSSLQETEKDDYIVYGSTQGILHIVDADTGEEKFAFVPHKMVEKQKDAFLHEAATTGGREKLFYGIDGAWVAHTEYVSREDGKSTVGLSNPKDADSPRGKQWIYGGLRMGGRNYYSLDLSNIANNSKRFDVSGRMIDEGRVTGSPTLKFNIDPDAQIVYSSTGSTAYPELAHMGQSWSKPALGYVNWPSDDPTKAGQLERRLVMFVGGGYDEGYETSNYQQNNGKGAGVYMFDANTGNLLWWASNNTVTGGKATKHSATGDDTNSLQYSVVSRINTVDRDSDGLVDALYFGDLGGQGFRIDLNNSASGANFSLRVVKIFDEHKADGTSPRFYEMPSISVHDADGVGRFAVVAFGSGDRSSPLAGEREDIFGNPITKNNKTADDVTIAVYDYDLGNAAWKGLTIDNLKTRHTKGALRVAELNSNFKGTDREVQVNGTNQGWKYTLISADDKRGRYKTFGEPFTITNLLFVNTYDRDGGGLAGECGGGVIGVSRTYQFCLPTGICSNKEHGYTRDLDTPIVSNATPGLVEMTLGRNDKGVGSNNVGNISASKDSETGTNQKVDCKKNPEAVECLDVEMPSALSQLRWFESRKEGK